MIYVALGFAALCVAALVFVMRWGMKAKDETIAAMTLISAMRGQLAAASTDAEQTEFELKTTKDALVESERRAELLAKELTDAMERVSLGAGLAAADVRGRVLRAAEAARARGAGALPAKPDEAVPDAEAASGTEDSTLRPLTPIDVLL